MRLRLRLGLRRRRRLRRRRGLEAGRMEAGGGGVPFHDLEVGVADACDEHAHDRLALLGRGHGDGLQRGRVAGDDEALL